MNLGPMNLRISRALWLLFVLLLGLTVRLIFLAYGGVIPDSDEAIVGLMAQHIAEGRQWPIFYYGQHYMGSLEPTLTAPVFMLFGQDAWTLKAVPLISCLLFIYSVYLLGCRIGGLTAGKIASFLAAVPPVAFVEWSTKARGGFIEVLLLGTIALNLAVSALRQSPPRRATLLLLAFVLGLGWWVNNQAIFYIAPIGLCLAPHMLRTCGFVRSLRHAAECFAAFIIGGLPFWYANLMVKPRFATFKQLGGHSKFPKETLEHLYGVFDDSLPILLGARRFWTHDDVFVESTAIAFALSVVTLIGVAIVFRRRIASRGLGLLLLMLFMTPLIFSLSAYGWLTIAPRYLLPLYSVWFVLIGVAATQLPSRLVTVLPAGFLLIALCSNYLGGISVPGQPFVANGERVSKDHTELYRWLEKRHFRHIRTNYWIGFRIAFETKEHVTFTLLDEPHGVRIPRYQEIGRDYLEETPFLLVPSQETKVAAALQQIDVPYVRSEVSGYVILEPVATLGMYLADPLDMHQIVDEEVLPVFNVRTTSRQSWSNQLVDGNASTRWGSGQPQQPGMFIEGEVLEGSVVQGIEVDLGFWLTDSARYLSVQVEQAGGQSCSIFDGTTAVLHDILGRILRFSTPPLKARKIRLEQLGSDPIFDWSIAELEVRGRREK